MTKMTNEGPVTSAILLGHVEEPGRIRERDHNLLVWQTVCWKSSSIISICKQRPSGQIRPGSYQNSELFWAQLRKASFIPVRLKLAVTFPIALVPLLGKRGRGNARM